MVTLLPSFSLRPAVLVLALAAIYPLHGHTAAGIAQFTSGDVNVRRGGNVVALGKGRPIESGDDVITGANGRAQLRFTDGAIVSLQPDSQFVISKYVDANDPKQDSYLVDFLRGSMRSITGLIGKRNRENYKVQTTTATIGIRGSGFSASYNTDGTIAITTELDEIEVCTRGGCVRLTAGESALVLNNDAAPTRNQIRATLPTPAPRQDVTVVGNSVTAGGLTAIVTVPSTIQTVSAGWQGAFVADSGDSSPFIGSNSNNTDQFTLDGSQLTKFVSTYDGITNEKLTLGSFNSAGQVADADFVGWGHWATASQTGNGNAASGNSSASPITVNDMHYVVGKPTANASISALNGMTGSYNLIGGTASFRSYTGASTVGTVVSGTLSVSFNASNTNILGSVTTQFGSTQVNVDLASTVSGASITGNSGLTSNTVTGFFTGTNATRAGLVFKTSSTPGMGSGSISGSAAFQQSALSRTTF